MAKKTDRRDLAALRELKHPWLVPLLACIYFVFTCMMLQSENKLITLLLILASIVCVVVRSTTLAKRLTFPALFLGLYVLMDGISTLYAVSGKFALYEFLKVMAAACMALLLTGCEPERGEVRTGRCAATVLEVAGALASFFSIDMVSTTWFYNALCGLIHALGVPFGNAALSGDRLNSIFENCNVFAGASGIALLLSLGLAASAATKRERCLHLTCLLFTCTAFILCVSRGAMLAVAFAFVAYLLLTRGAQRAVSLVLMVETLVLTMAASLITFAVWHNGQSWPLIVTILCAAALCVLDIHVGRPLAEKVSAHLKAVNILLLSALAAVAVLAVVAISWTGPATLQPGESLYRVANVGEGEYTLSVTADAPLNVDIRTQRLEGGVLSVYETAYSGAADGAVFTAPEGTVSVMFTFTGETEATITDISYDGAASGHLKLHYKLLPESIGRRVQTIVSDHSIIERITFLRDGMKLFKRSPIIGLGMGSFENASYSVQTYHYETKYVHCHFLQVMIEIGLVGLVFWLGLLVTSAIAILRLWRRGKDGEPHPMVAALGATLLFLTIHGGVEVDFSVGYFLPFGIGAFAVINLTCGRLLPVPKLSEKHRRLLVWGSTLCMAVFGVLLSMNMRAAVIASQRDYTSIAQAAELDPYEWADYKLSYVVAASSEESRSADMQERMERYMADLAALSSNSVPRYLAQCYFNLGDTEQAFTMLRKFVDYTPSDPDTWENTFRTVMENDDGSEAFREGVATLTQRLEAWNAQNAGTITLAEDIQAYLAQ